MAEQSAPQQQQLDAGKLFMKIGAMSYQIDEMAQKLAEQAAIIKSLEADLKTRPENKK